MPLVLLSLTMAAQIGGARRLVTLLLVLVWLSCARGLSISRQRLEVRKHLKRLNKPAVKSIKVPFLLVGSEIFIQWFFCSFSRFFSGFYFLLHVFACSVLGFWIDGYLLIGDYCGLFFGG